MARVKSQPTSKAPSEPGGGATQRRHAWTGKETVTAGAQGLQEQLKMKKQCQQPLLFRIDADNELVILFAPFARLVRGITEFHSREVTQWTPEAVLLLLHAAEFILEEMFKMERVPIIKQNQEQASRARTGGTQDLALHIVTKPATTRHRCSVETPKEMEEPSRSGRENCVSKGQNIVAMDAPLVASTTTNRRQRCDAEAPAEGPGIRQRSKRARRPCSLYPDSQWARGRENCVSKGQNIVAMEALLAASTTANRRQRCDVEALAEGPGIHQRAKRARRPCSLYPDSDWARGKENCVSKGQNIIAMEAPLAASTIANRRQRCDVDAPAEGPGFCQRTKRARRPCSLYPESDWARGKENCVSKGQNIIAIETPLAASITASRRQRCDVEALAEGPGIHQHAKRARRPCSIYPDSDWAL